MNFKEKEDLKNLANIELQLALSTNLDKCEPISLDDYEDIIELKEILKSNIMYYKKHSIIILGFLFLFSIFFLKISLYILPFIIIGFIITSFLHFKYKKTVNQIRSILYHIEYTKTVYNLWLDEIIDGGYIKTHLIEKNILKKYNITNTYINYLPIVPTAPGGDVW